MRKIDPPSFDVDVSFSSCVDGKRPSALKQRLIAVTGHINSEESAYLQKSASTSWYSIAQTRGILGRVTTSEMAKLYDRTFVRSKKTRHLYSHLRTLCGICPFCCQEKVETLDHFLPKEKYPSFAVTPVNLVPACSRCNKAKSTSYPSSEAEQYFHPYFEDTDDARWLFAEVDEKNPAVVNYHVSPPTIWSPVNRRRVERQFRLLNLGDLYRTYAAEDLNEMRYNLKILHSVGGPDAVRQHLLGEFLSCSAVRKNSRRAAMFDALAASTWFCDGGFL